MAEQTIQCPICSQEFPLYDQRGFRNAGFTAHRKWCTDRQQQQKNDGRQQDQQSTRASRFAMAIRRKLLPATQAHTPANEGPSRISPMPIFAGSSTSSIRSDPTSSRCTEPSTPPFDTSTPALHSQLPLRQHHHFQQQQQQRRQPILRQRHTWHHWNTRKEIPRRTSMNAMTISSKIVPSTSAPTPPTSWTLQMGNSPRAMDPESHASSTYSLLNASATADSWTAPAIPFLSDPSASPDMAIGTNPFTFASMYTTLPLEYSRNETTSINANYNDTSGGTQPSQLFTQADIYASTDPTLGSVSSGPITTIQQQHYYEQQSQTSYQGQQNDGYPDLFIDSSLTLSQAPGSFIHHQNHQQQINVASGSASTFLPTTTSSPNTYDEDNYQSTVLYCEYCQPRNGLHDPSCNLLQFFLTNIMDDNENTFSSA